MRILPSSPLRAALRIAAAAAAVVCASAVVACDSGNGNKTPTSQATESSQITQTPQSGGAPGGAQPSGPQLADPTLKLTPISGIESPTQIAFLGPDDLLVTEKTTGRVVRVTAGKVVGPVVQLKTNFADERGVLGITLHPQFAQNHYVYVYWTWTGEGAEPDGLFGPPSDDIEKVPPLGNRVDRFTWDGTQLNFDRNIIQLPSRTTDLTVDRRRGNHDAGVIKFGPDGKLYVVIGDQNFRGPLQNIADGPSEGGNNGLLGVVLRLNDDGSTPPDNPFVGKTENKAWEDIFIYGVRNSFGYDWEPRTNEFWMEINGQASYDEISRFGAGDDSGWIQVQGPSGRFDDYKALEQDTERLLDNPSFPPDKLGANKDEALSRLFLLPGATYREPSFSWRYAVAPTSLGFVRGAALGDEYDGNMLVGDVNTGSIYRFRMTPDRMNIALDGPLADGVNDNTKQDPIGEMKDSLFATGIFVATDIKTGPDGTVWIASLAGNTIYHVTR